MPSCSEAAAAHALLLGRSLARSDVPARGELINGACLGTVPLCIVAATFVNGVAVSGESNGDVDGVVGRSRGETGGGDGGGRAGLGSGLARG